MASRKRGLVGCQAHQKAGDHAGAADQREQQRKHLPHPHAALGLARVLQYIFQQAHQRVHAAAGKQLGCGVPCAHLATRHDPARLSVPNGAVHVDNGKEQAGARSVELDYSGLKEQTLALRACEAAMYRGADAKTSEMWMSVSTAWACLSHPGQ